jgi:hemoglobin
MSTTRFIRAALLALLTSGAMAGARAQPAVSALYRDLGERPGIEAISKEFVDRVKADPRLGPFFKDVNSRHLVKQLTDQWCQVAGGPCEYDGETMKKSHAEMGIGKVEFNLAVEVLQAAMVSRGVPFSTQNQLLAILAPMHRDIITK